MALFKYFKCTEGHHETPPSLTTNDMKKANESIAKALEVKGRGKYNTYTPGQYFLLSHNAVLHLPSVLVHVETSNAAVNFIDTTLTPLQT